MKLFLALFVLLSFEARVFAGEAIDMQNYLAKDKAAILRSGFSPSGVQKTLGMQMTLQNFVQAAGNKCDVFFTLEGAYPGATYSSMLLAEQVSVQGFSTNVDSVILILTNSITNLAVIRDAGNRQIYHIVDKRLLTLSDYAMNQVLESIKFRGDAAGFVNQIKEKYSRLSNKQFSTGGFIISNDSTPVSIDATNVSMRDALSDGIKLQEKRRLIWVSFTSLETREAIIGFQGNW